MAEHADKHTLLEKRLSDILYSAESVYEDAVVDLMDRLGIPESEQHKLEAALIDYVVNGMLDELTEIKGHEPTREAFVAWYAPQVARRAS